MTEEISRTASFLWTLIRVVCASAVVGAGIGFLEGETAGRGWARGDQMALAEGASSVGLIVAAIVGTIAYYLLSNKISLNIFFGVVTSVLATGFTIAFWTRNEMITALGNVLIAVVALVYVAVREPRTQRDGV